MSDRFHEWRGRQIAAFLNNPAFGFHPTPVSGIPIGGIPIVGIPTRGIPIGGIPIVGGRGTGRSISPGRRRNGRSISPGRRGNGRSNPPKEGDISPPLKCDSNHKSCKKCKNPFERDDNFCSSCGKRRYCKECCKSAAKGKEFCPSCGINLKDLKSKMEELRYD